MCILVAAAVTGGRRRNRRSDRERRASLELGPNIQLPRSGGFQTADAVVGGAAAARDRRSLIATRAKTVRLCFVAFLPVCACNRNHNKPRPPSRFRDGSCAANARLSR